MASSEVSAVTDQWATVEADAVQLMWLGTQVVLRSAFLVAKLQGFRPQRWAGEIGPTRGGCSWSSWGRGRRAWRGSVWWAGG